MTFRKVFPKRILISESKVQNSKFELAFIYTSLEVKVLGEHNYSSLVQVRVKDQQQQLICSTWDGTCSWDQKTKCDSSFFPHFQV